MVESQDGERPHETDAVGQEAVEITPISKVWLDRHGIGHIVYLSDPNITIEALQLQCEVCKRLSCGRAVPVIVDVRNVRYTTREVRMFMSGPDVAPFTLAVAALVGSAFSRFLGGFFIGLNRPSYPIRLFTSEPEAIAWLRKFVASPP